MMGKAFIKKVADKFATSKEANLENADKDIRKKITYYPSIKSSDSKDGLYHPHYYEIETEGKFSGRELYMHLYFRSMTQDDLAKEFRIDPITYAKMVRDFRYINDAAHALRVLQKRDIDFVEKDLHGEIKRKWFEDWIEDLPGM